MRLARSGITEARHLDMWTALVTGLVDQQISNDPGGERWIGLIDESVAMFLRHCDETAAPAKRARSRATTGLPHTTMKETVHDHQGR